jgi:phasin family protein
MYPYPQSVNPAVRSHLDAQVAFFNELSQTVARSYQQAWQLNMQLGQTLLEEATHVGQRMMTMERPTEAMSAAASRAQPATDKLRAYQQQLSQLAADTQVDLTRVTEQHVQDTSRTARALADEVTRVAIEETDKNMRQQEEAIKNFRDPFKQDGARAGNAGSQSRGNLQSSGDGAAQAGVRGGTQGGQAQQSADRNSNQIR